MKFTSIELAIIYDLLKHESKNNGNAMISHLITKIEIEGKIK